jgi:hypothetical protein
MGWVICLVGLLAGCADKRGEAARDARLAKLEAQVAELRTQSDSQWGYLTNLAEITQNGFVTNAMGIAEISILQAEEMANYNTLKEAITNLMVYSTNRPKQVVYYPAATAPERRVGVKAGVPLDIYDKIAADAAREWPGNYQMQAYSIKSQIQSYKKLHP